MTRAVSFFLSYAHSVPLSDRRGTDDTDIWVRRCFDDLKREVTALTGAPSADTGFVDYQAGPGADWKAMLDEQLGRADVFVPLYSPGYFNKSWPQQERAAFLDRVERAFPGEPERGQEHIVPVLWIPLLGPGATPVPRDLARAVSLGTAIPEYAENGLRALLMLTSYATQYHRILVRLARRIVEVAEASVLPPGHSVSIGDIPRLEPAPGTTPFVVGVLGPAGPWKPFGKALDLPIAEYAANVAERLGLPAQIAERPADLKAMDTAPAVLLVDHRVSQGRLATLRGRIHPWVRPVVVGDRADRAGPVVHLLKELGATRVKSAHDVTQFAQMMPSVVSEARRQYLRQASVQALDGYPRPRLDGDGSAPPASERSSDG
ncbi:MULTISPECIES: TIR-like protein FxsC [Actinoplanes]|uniref:TIR-like protein FxsC n=1 Tax=Actinoplanes TaxID=1865 RepID=UPI0005F2A449|nr:MULTISPECIES: TIR-like protein FxsC [Actinoplanes]GLY00194.1 hypothetical protein Acsp01_05730 [Actinoplanes sp. NBRC 101535]